MAAKILQIIQKRQLRGAEIFACQLSEELNKIGNTVDVVYLFDGNASFPDFNLNLICLHAKARKKLRDINAFRRLAEIVKDGGYNAVQANAGDALKYAVLSRLIWGWKAKIVFRNASLMSTYFKGWFHRSFNRWLLKKCDFIISVSEQSRHDLASFYPGALSKSLAIPIGTYTFEKVSPIARDVPSDEVVFVAVGSFVPEKNHSFMLEVFNLFFRQNAKGYLWLVGDGVLRSAIVEKIDRLGIKDRVRFWGYRSDVISILKASDILLMPSVVEGVPAAILEASSCGIPVVASKVGGIPEVIENGVTGLCIPGWSAQEYVNGISTLVSDQSYRRKLVEASKEKFKEKFFIGKIAADFDSEYKRLTNAV